MAREIRTFPDRTDSSASLGGANAFIEVEDAILAALTIPAAALLPKTPNITTR